MKIRGIQNAMIWIKSDESLTHNAAKPSKYSVTNHPKLSLPSLCTYVVLSTLSKTSRTCLFTSRGLSLSHAEREIVQRNHAESYTVPVWQKNPNNVDYDMWYAAALQNLLPP